MRHLGGVPGSDRARAVHEQRMAGIARGDWYRTIVPDDGSEPVGLVGIWRTEWADTTIYEFGIMLLPAAPGTAEHAGPARVCAPAGDLLGRRGLNLRVEVETEVVGGGEVDQPVVADPDAPAVDLLDDLIPEPCIMQRGDAEVTGAKDSSLT